MPPLPVIADTFRVAMFWQGQSGLLGQTVMHFQKAAASAASVAADVDANVTASMWTHTNTNTKVTELHVTPLDGSSATYILAVTGAKWAGTSGASDVVPASAVVVSFRTGLRGKSNRGRIYLPFTSENVIADGKLLAANVAIGQPAWNAFLAAMIAVPDFPVVASYKLATKHQITSIVYEGTLGTQRRRQQRLR